MIAHPIAEVNAKTLRSCLMSIIRLSAKGTDVVMKPAAFRTFAKFVTISTERSVHYRTRGGEWWGCIAATPHVYMVRSSVKASTIGANKQPVNLSLSNRLDFAG